MDLSGCSKLLILLISIHLIVVFDFSDGYGTLKVTFHAYEFDTKLHRCDAANKNGGGEECDPRFEVALSQRMNRDLFYYKMDYDYRDRDVVLFHDTIGNRPNPIEKILTDNTGQVNLKINIVDIEADQQHGAHMFALDINLKTTRNSGQIATWYHDVRVRLSISYSFKCDDNDIGTLCNDRCEPPDSTKGDHYICNADGSKTCMKGWTGPRCGNKIECKGSSSQPCQNGGVCKQMDATNYQCECPKGYLGKNCVEPAASQCRSVVCQNGGTCQGTVGSDYKCNCRPGFLGTHCETDKIRCNSKNCPPSGGKCREFIGGFECICNREFQGVKCDIDVDECAAKNPCINGGTCTNTASGFNCTCPAGLNGSLCQTNTDECTQPQPSPHCGDGTRCVNTPDTFACLPVDLDDCAGDKKCLNGGECVDKKQHFICLCPTGFNGPTCNEPASAVSPFKP